MIMTPPPSNLGPTLTEFFYFAGDEGWRVKILPSSHPQSLVRPPTPLARAQRDPGTWARGKRRRRRPRLLLLLLLPKPARALAAAALSVSSRNPAEHQGKQGSGREQRKPRSPAPALFPRLSFSLPPFFSPSLLACLSAGKHDAAALWVGGGRRERTEVFPQLSRRPAAPSGWGLDSGGGRIASPRLEAAGGLGSRSRSQSQRKRASVHPAGCLKSKESWCCWGRSPQPPVPLPTQLHSQSLPPSSSPLLLPPCCGFADSSSGGMCSRPSCALAASPLMGLPAQRGWSWSA
uniref:Uncharacterized protein LOC110199707 n=1 Tax=Phascolarctos cinereus TaxID=38626 RepID=A0A6P5JGM1_PHACI|nr:uncharacterized protein LOC110199707 [Phascolarctos cinereus]